MGPYAEAIMTSPSTPSCVALIPARGGSKRIPKKNIRPFRGVPALSRTIVTAQRSGIFERIIVSTDDPNAAALAKAAGADVLIRPTALSDDHATTADVVAHTLETLPSPLPDILCCLYPLAMFTTPDMLRRALALLKESDAACAYPVTPFPSPPQRAQTIGPNGSLTLLFPEMETIRSQDLPEAVYDAGQFYMLRTKDFAQQKRIYAQPSLPLMIPAYAVQDIDTEEDWQAAEIKHRLLEELSQ